ncbi:hypothetical protein CFter6_4073 [Collimonas fungivorans]|uniref:Uncharacterized protein n=1 Tax=Collimonas fungivorans TaxID=158899 RepID=A0A127PFU7_9BURK|nr:hypothetical protein CFter6_4073 [Collimonas fungivorans]
MSDSHIKNMGGFMATQADATNKTDGNPHENGQKVWIT